VGDIVKVKEMETFPADLIVVSSNFEKGECYIETASLDGEKNVKPRMSPKETLNSYHNSTGIMRLEGRIICGLPDPDLGNFNGSLFYMGKKIFVNIKQFLYRGAILKNTKWVIGIVAYTGNDTKILRNSEESKFKQSNVEEKMNHLLMFILLFQAICCIFSACGNYIWHNLEFKKHWYLYLQYDIKIEAVLTYFTYFLLYNTMIPISLIVTLEMVK